MSLDTYKDIYTKASKTFSKATDVLLETIWPTRCAVCDEAGNDVLCERCEQKLKVIDRCRACEKCGAPYGLVQCTECNEVMLKTTGIDELPFDVMSHALILDDASRQLVTVYKDGGERRLADIITRIMLPFVNPRLKEQNYVLTFIPDSKAAVRRRGFDHGEELASKLSLLCGLTCKQLLEAPNSLDQRHLTRTQRQANMKSMMKAKSNVTSVSNVLLIDDVCTTGATIYSACSALKQVGVKNIEVLTFAQVMD